MVLYLKNVICKNLIEMEHPETSDLQSEIESGHLAELY